MAGCQNYWKMQSELTWWPKSTWPLLLNPGAIHTPKQTYAKNSVLASIFILAVLSVIQSDMFPFHSESQERRGLFSVVSEGLSRNKWAENEQGKLGWISGAETGQENLVVFSFASLYHHMKLSFWFLFGAQVEIPPVWMGVPPALRESRLPWMYSEQVSTSMRGLW